jgi:diaminohydroxyphosphoribosylaminopyrimidine deaminase / 5-amino-6-(5-phosphoribosylamino)uracil reductase
MSSPSHEVFIQRAIILAKKGVGFVSPNPMVGAVIVYQNRILAEGWHKGFGGPHAEIEAINAVADKEKSLFIDSTLYITLEPCSHHGKTPPCAEAIVRAGFRQVVIGCLDPNPLVAGQGISFLKKAGILVTVGVAEADCRNLIAPFVHGILTQTPYTILKWAQTPAGYLGSSAEQVAVSQPLTQRITHLWRHEVDAILIGARTALIDNPSLTNRFYVGGKNPVRIILDKYGDLSFQLQVFDQSAITWLVAPKKPKDLPNHVVWIESDINVTTLPDLMKYWYQQKIGTLLVEGGASTHQLFFDSNAWNEARVITGIEQDIDNGVSACLIRQKPVDSYINGLDRIDRYVK